MICIQCKVSEADAGRKIKYFVRGSLQISYKQYCAMKAEGGLRVNGETIHADYILKEGDFVTAELLEYGAPKQVLPEDGPLDIVYEDADIYILDKPAPLACQATPKQATGTLENRLYAHFSEVEDFVFRPLNRLDRGTSGLMAVAKHAHAYQILQRQLHTPKFIREYLAVVEGVLEGAGSVELPIAKEDCASVRRVIDHERGVAALTHYEGVMTDGCRSLIRLRLETGRTHQIRVHMAALGHPIVGDFLYGEELPSLKGRFALHSARIELEQPLTGAHICRVSPLPQIMKGLIQKP